MFHFRSQPGLSCHLHLGLELPTVTSGAQAFWGTIFFCYSMVSRSPTPETPSYSTGHTDGYPSQETLFRFFFFFCLKLYDHLMFFCVCATTTDKVEFSPLWLRGEEFSCQRRRRMFNPWIGKIPWRRKWQPTPAFLSGDFHGCRSQAGCSSWSHKRAGRRI